MTNTPVQDNFFMPAEFEPQTAVWMAWPFRNDNWRNGAIPAQHAFVEVANAISTFTQVYMVAIAHEYENARFQLPNHIPVIEMSYNDSWMRDMGPTFVKNSAGIIRGIHWQFNAWGGLEGGLYFPWDLDCLVPPKVIALQTALNHSSDYTVYHAPFVLEGGSVHVDGQGTLLTTEECLLNPNRNPTLSKSQIASYLKAYLHVEKIIWLPNGCYHDETNGHVDNIACFAKPGEVILHWTDDRTDPQYVLSEKALHVLENTLDAKGRNIKVHKLYAPKPVYITEEEAAGVTQAYGTLPRQAGERMAASYVNFLITNGGIVFPKLDPKTDDQAKHTLQEIFPNYTIIGVQAREILLGGGNIHCITQQVPR